MGAAGFVIHATPPTLPVPTGYRHARKGEARLRESRLLTPSGRGGGGGKGSRDLAFVGIPREPVSAALAASGRARVKNYAIPYNSTQLSRYRRAHYVYGSPEGSESDHAAFASNFISDYIFI